MKKKQKIRIFKKKSKILSEDDEISQLQELYDKIDCNSIKTFEDLPLSQKTLKGLKKHNYITPTEIQRDSIGCSLRGEDVLGAAKTGSGKTLAFLVPVLEKLYCAKWTRNDGVGALVITPTRELAYQIFEMLKKVGEFHDFSAGLIIGGKDLKFERKRMDQCNIVICTPGRLLQHMDENPLFDCGMLQILVLDEADRCLDMGFEKTMNSIIENLPEQRQTLLFSATQTKSVKDLARLSLTNPRYISVHEDAKFSTPAGLVQSYIKCELHDKMNFLWSFIKNHKSQKILIFLSSCKQVKYTYEALCRLRPGVTLLALYGTLHQSRRMAIYDSFCQKQHAVLFATDIAARGLDFPAVNWVVQLDCPESANEYIHRAGRTARYERAGESLLVLLPSEVKMLEHLERKKIPIEEIQVNMNKLQNIQRSLEAMLARDKNMKESAQRAFVAYIKSVYLMKDKEVFSVTALDTDAYARSLGLVVSPRIRFLQKRQKMIADKEKELQEDERVIDKLADKDFDNENEDDAASSDGAEESQIADKKPQPAKIEKVDSRKITLNFYGDDDDEDDFIYLKRKDHELDIQPMEENEMRKSKKSAKPISRVALAKKMLKKNILPNKKVIFNDEGEVVPKEGKEYISELGRQYEKSNEAGIDIATAQQVLREEDKFDKELFRRKIKEKHRQERKKMKEEKRKKSAPQESSSQSESDDEDDYEPDLSWLPDVDKLNSRKSENESANSDGSQSEDYPENVKKAKRKRNLTKKSAKKMRPDDGNDDYIDTGLSLVDDEEVALRLMQG